MKNEQQRAFKTAVVTGALRELVAKRGGTGDLRKDISKEERGRRNKRNKQSKMSRRINRRKGV
jgi:hypothetical protein